MDSIPFSHPGLDDLVRCALAEDIGSGDITTGILIDAASRGRARVTAKEELILAGTSAFQRVFALLSDDVTITSLKPDGTAARGGDTVCELEGAYATLLTGERTALNFLQHLSGIATRAHRFAEKLTPYKAVLLDTRKTTPGLRVLEKEAVRLGGGTNHRMGLFDAVLIKENHIAARGSITRAVEAVSRIKSPHMHIEVEVQTIDELKEALAAKPDLIMLDNMGIDEMIEAVAAAAGAVPLEASGNVTLDSIEQIAATGVDYISVGALTHSARAVDLSMIIEPV